MAVAWLYAGCPDIPGPLLLEANSNGWVEDEDAGTMIDEDAVIPLTLDKIEPNTGGIEGGARISIFGGGFEPGSSVLIGGLPATSTLVLDENQLNCDVPPHPAGLVDVTVERPDGQIATLGSAFLYRAPFRLSSFEPEIASLRSQAMVTVSGEFFTDDLKVLVGGRLLKEQQFIDPRTIQGVLPERMQGTHGWVDVAVSSGFEQRLLPRALRYVDDLTMTWLSPVSGPTSGDTYITLYGTGFGPDTYVTVGSTVAEVVQVLSEKSMVIRTSPTGEGPVDLAITNEMETIVISQVFSFIDTNTPSATVALIHVWPNHGSVEGVTQIALTVLGLSPSDTTDTVSVRFDNSDAVVLEVRPAENLIVVGVPAHAEGSVSIHVESLSGTSSDDLFFTYEPTLRVDTFTAQSGSTVGGKTITLEGEGFSTNTQVYFGAEQAEVKEEPTETILKVLVPPGVPGRVDIQLVHDSRVVTYAAAFEYLWDGAAELLVVSTGDGAQSGGRILKLFGRGFQQAAPAEVRVGEELLDDLEVHDNTTIVVRAPRGEVGTVTVDAGDTGRLAMVYEYFDPTSRYGGTHGGPIPEAINITVLDALTHEPVHNAYVIAWDDLTTPYQGLTDDRGQLTFSDLRFGPPQMITAGKDMYTTASVVDFDARNVTLILIPLSASPPGGGGGGFEPQELDDGILTGSVSGFDKYVIPPPGQCDPKLEDGAILEDANLCNPCATDEDCLGESAQCTYLGQEGYRCTIACETESDCPPDFRCTSVGFGQVQCIPEPGERTLWCGTTIPDVFSVSAEPTGSFAEEPTFYQLPSPPGEHAVVCLGGYQDPDTDEFIPMMMGMRRHVFTMPGDVVAYQDVKLDIPLSRTLHLRLDDPPSTPEAANQHRLQVFIDLGSDGVFPMPQRVEGTDLERVEMENFPVTFEESLYDASYSILAGAFTLDTLAGLSNESSITYMQGITDIHDDAIYEVFPQGAAVRSTGIKNDIHALHGPGTGRLWAVGSKGQILVWDGIWWALQQAPTNSTLRAVWAANHDDVWAAGDKGAVLRFNGLIWEQVLAPDGLEAANWVAIHGQIGHLWLVGDQGLWHVDESGWTLQDIDFASSVRSMWSTGPEELWLVGDGGMIRRWTPTGVENMDAPGDDLLAVNGAHGADVWAVGRHGRIVHWNGDVWFDYLSRTRRDLYAVHAPDPLTVWAAGEAGSIVKWDGIRWEVHNQSAQVDLRGIRVTGGGEILAAGVHTIVVGPFLEIPKAGNPDADGIHSGLELNWTLDPHGPEASFTYLQMSEQSGFPFWMLMVNGERHSVPLPDLKAAWGLQSIWPGTGLLRFVRVYMPSFDIDAHDNTMLTQHLWRSWSMVDFPVNW
jgi:hypothetical protein